MLAYSLVPSNTSAPNKHKAESPFIRNGRYVCVSVYICVYVKKIPPTILSLYDSIYPCTYIQVRMREQKYGCNHFLSDFLRIRTTYASICHLNSKRSKLKKIKTAVNFTCKPLSKYIHVIFKLQQFIPLWLFFREN